jgi:acetoin utilization deacetylase AcuC-like enzyme
MNVSYKGFAEMTRIVQELADNHCDGKLSFILEGGYNLESLSRGVHTVLKVLSGQEVPKPTTPGIQEVEAALAFHKNTFKNNG